MSAPVIMHRWRYAKPPYSNPWKIKVGKVIGWEMDEESAACFMQANPGCVIEKVPGSDYVRPHLGDTGSLHTNLMRSNKSQGKG